ncbi:alpha/beta fold hydrolase [Fuscibacter oryzae]|uniref:Alpha/beta hydrolase n=1 Tax=Fuscibacter oryzae TaxID=2803939 RepID=A0A8J7MSZ7_9RHOB|nr:alpha/beta hydrolase [Fuscibacter oryzae]MBL4926794.1 alpha/beta hydrolase [Fuscibacter oryzae]
MTDLPPHRAWGPSDAPPVLALHCSLSHAGEWSALSALLSGVRLVAADQPGHGHQPDWDGQSDLHAQAVREAAAAAGMLGSPVDVIGHSFGATVALRLALERPDLVKRLVLVEPVLFAAAEGDPAFVAFQSRNAQLPRLIAAGGAEAAAAAFYADWGGGADFASLPAGLRAYMVARIAIIPAQNGVLVQDEAALLAAGRLEGLRCPVLLVEGTASPPVVAAIQTTLARRLPDARRECVDGAGHMLPVTHAAALAPLVAAHLA